MSNGNHGKLESIKSQAKSASPAQPQPIRASAVPKATADGGNGLVVLTTVESREPKQSGRELTEAEEQAGQRQRLVRVLQMRGIEGDREDSIDDETAEERRREMLKVWSELVESVSIANETALRLDEEALHHAVQHEHGLHHGTHGRISNVSALDEGDLRKTSNLAALQSSLTLVQGVLRLAGSGMVEAARKDPGLWGVVWTAGDVIRSAIEIAVGAIGTVARFAEFVATRSGDKALAVVARNLYAGTVIKFSSVFAAIQVVHGLALAMKSGAALEQKIEGAGEAASGGGFLIGKAIGGAVGGAIFSVNLYFVVKAVGELLLAHERGRREAWVWNYIDQIAKTLASALSDGYVESESSGGETELAEARRAAFNDAIRILRFWGPRRTRQLGEELARETPNKSALLRRLRSEIAAGAGLKLDAVPTGGGSLHH